LGAKGGNCLLEEKVPRRVDGVPSGEKTPVPQTRRERPSGEDGEKIEDLITKTRGKSSVLKEKRIIETVERALSFFGGAFESPQGEELRKISILRKKILIFHKDTSGVKKGIGTDRREIPQE